MKIHRGLLFIFLILLSGTAYFSMSAMGNSKRADTAFQLVNHTHNVINYLDNLETSVASLESNVRAYVITGKPIFLREESIQRAQVLSDLDSLKKLTADNATQQKELVNLEKLIQQKLRFQNEIIEANTESNQKALETIATLKGKNITDDLRAVVHLMRKEEQRLLHIRVEDMSAISAQKLNSTLFLCALAMVLSVFALFKINSENNLRKKAENEAKRNESKYKGLVDNSALLIYTSDLEGKFIFISSKGEELTGYPPATLIGSRLFDLVPHEWQTKVESFYKNQLATKTPETCLVFPIQTKTGELKWVERTSVLVFENDVPIYFQSIVKDITEKKKTEERLAQAENELKAEQEESQYRLQSILNNVPLGMYIKDLEGRYVMVNKGYEELVGKNSERIIGKKIDDINKDSASAERYKIATKQLMTTLQPVELEDVMHAERERHMLTIQFPLFDKQDQLFGIGVACKDVSDTVSYREELVRARLKAEQAEKLQEEFLANMSHEIRTPMNGITGMANLLQGTALSATQEEYVQIIQQSADSLLVLINDILDLSKIKAGRMHLEVIDFNVVEVIDKVINPLQVKATSKGLKLKKEVSVDVPFGLKGDAHKLQQVLNNLVDNAVKFTNKGEIQIAVSVKEQQGAMVTLHFDVNDTGIGIAPEDMSLIFDSFAQAASDTTRKFGGTGLGLSITKRLIELQGGSITVSSTIGSGSSFSFELTYEKTGNKLLQPTHLKDSGLLGQKGSIKFDGNKILLVEDNLVNQKVAYYTLKKANLEIDIANNAKEAIDLIEGGAEYDLIIMDLQMPVMDGYQGTAYIRNQLKLDTPIIMMTGSVLRDEKTKCLQIGVNEFLPKPFAPSDLLRHVKYFIDAKGIDSTEHDKKTTEAKQLYNLSHLHEVEDEQYFTEVLELFLQNTPILFTELKDLVLQEQWEAVGDKAHKLKSSLGLLQMNEMLAIASIIEINAKERSGLEAISSLIKNLSNQYALVKPMIESDLQKAKQVSV